MDKRDIILDQLDIVAHLFFAAGSIDTVSVRGPGGASLAKLRYPEDPAEGFAISLLEPFPLARGSLLVVEYEGLGNSYRFCTEVLAVEADHVQVSLPTAVDRGDRRLTPRLRLTPQTGVVFHAHVDSSVLQCPVVDLSEGGFAIHDRTGLRLEQGDVLRGFLALPQGDGDLPVAVQIRNVRLEFGERTLGCRFEALPLEVRTRLVVWLSRWGVREEITMATKGAS